MLEAAARRRPPDRLRLWTTHVGQAIIAVEICVAAGTELSYWNGGWDGGYARLKPGLVTLVAAIV